jgi:Smr domain-containing protein
MKFQPGDIVLVLHSNEEGEVVDIINDKMVMVDVRGVQFPAYTDQIDFPYFKRFTEKKLFPGKKEKKFVDDLRKEKPGSVRKIADGMWLTFLPILETDEFGDEVVEDLKVHLINRTETAYKFDYKLAFFGKPEFELKNIIHPFEDFYLHDVPFEDLSDSPFFEFEFSLEKPDKAKAEICTASLKLKPKQLFTKIEEIRSKNEASFSYRLFDAYPDKLPEEKIDMGDLSSKYNIYDAAKGDQHLEPPRSVIDLHIEKLTDNWQRMSNLEILNLQLKTFEKYYELAVAHLQPSLVVIHGVGSGRLRDDIHEWLKYRREVKTFVNQYDPRFGYGATEILFEY